MTRFGTIVGTGRYLPEVEVSNEAMKERLSQVNPALAGVVDNFQESTGIRRRWYAPRNGRRRTSPCARRRPRWTRPALRPSSLT